MRPRRPLDGRAVLAGVVTLGAAVVGVLAAPLLPHRSPASGNAGSADPAASLPAPVTPAFTPGRPRPLGSTRHLSHWAALRHRVVARAQPAPMAAPVATVPAHTPEGTGNVVAVLGERRGGDRRPWVHVRLAVLPNGTTAWVPRRALGGIETVDTRLDVDLRALTATLRRTGRVVLRVRIAAGMPGWPTPRGTFYVRNRLSRYRSAQYGPVAFGLSARSPRATDWPAGGFVGIHGTDRPELVPGRVSHGCIRLRNADVLRLARAMPVGTPVLIH